MTDKDWVTLLLIPGTVVVWRFFEIKLWPWISKRIDAGAKQREEDEDEARLRQEARDERRVRAQEQTAQALDLMGRTLSVMQMQIAMIERHTGMTAGGKVQAKVREE